MTKKALLTFLFLFALVPAAQAYSPPPATTIFLLSRPRSATITIELPPRLIMTPDKLLFPQAGIVYQFRGEKFEPEQGLFPNHKVITTKNGSGFGTYYTITVKDFKIDDKRPPDANDFRLTFKPTVSKENINDLESYLKNRLNFVPTARLSGSNCDTSGGKKSHICLNTFTRVTVPGKTLTVAPLFQTIPLKGIIVSGNSAAPGGTLANFIQSGNALAIGGGIFSSLDGGKTISEYNFANSPIQWATVGSKLIEQFDSNKSYNKNEVVIYDDANWNLNSSDRFNPSISDKDTFSTPPEGRLWNVYADPSKPQNHWRNDFYNIGKTKNVGTLFSGAGTVSVRRTGTEGSMPVTVHGGVPCAPGTRFALITKGDIVFDTPADGELKIDCGAYISLEGNIIFANDDIKKGTVNGIFIAKGNILLPDPDRLTDTFNINPDTNILKNPPVLLRELLKIVFGTSS